VTRLRLGRSRRFKNHAKFLHPSHVVATALASRNWGGLIAHREALARVLGFLDLVEELSFDFAYENAR
jgi:hypothetical protein